MDAPARPAPKQLCFATCEKRPAPTDDDRILVEAFAALSVEVRACPWTALPPLSGGPPVLLRSTWDYYRQAHAFRAWLQAHVVAGTAMLNAPAVALGNMDKRYLLELEAQGIAIPRTRWPERPTEDAVQALLAEEGWERAVLKPRISATAYGTVVVQPGARIDPDALAASAETGGLVQEFLPEIAMGELSLIFIDGGFNHAVRKVPRQGDFRVQCEFGGRNVAVVPTPHAVQLAERTMATMTDPCIYGRVDLVETARGPLLMELELIEPELFFRLDPGAAPRLAAAVRRRLWPGEP